MKVDREGGVRGTRGGMMQVNMFRIRLATNA